MKVIVFGLETIIRQLMYNKEKFEMDQNTFLDECLEGIYIQESFDDIIQKFRVPSRLKSIESAIKTKKPSNIVRTLSFLPTLKIDTIKKIGRKRIKNFDKYWFILICFKKFIHSTVKIRCFFEISIFI